MTLTTGEITAMRATLDASLPGTAIIKRATWTSDGQGGSTSTWAAVGTVDARLSPSQGRQRVEPVAGGGLVAESDWVATLPVGTDITTRDRLTYSDADYEVLAIDSPRSWDVAMRVELVRVA